MIRVIFYLILVGLLAYGVTLFADRPGDVIITWEGMRAKTSVMVLAVSALAAVVALMFLFWLVRAIVMSPVTISRMRRRRRHARAYEAISTGLIAVGAGDVGAARKLAAEVNRLAPGEPLSLLLSAQAAQLAGDLEAAERAFHAMARRIDTKAIGLRGLFIEARRRNNHVHALAYAEEAARTTPSLGWAGRAVLEARCRDNDWAGALVLLDRNKNNLDKADYRRQRAVLLTARALAIEDSDRDSAKSLVLEAEKLAPTLVPAAVLAARLLAEGGEQRKASRIIDQAWAANPHPELAQAAMELRSGESARDRLRRIEALVRKTPDNIESALAVARAATSAQEFAKARAALAPYLPMPTKRVALLMAEIERAEHNDDGRSREWTARAVHAAPDPAWTADGYVSDRWLPASPVTGRLDAFVWRVPLSGMLGAPVIEPEPLVAAPPAELAPPQASREPDAAPAAATETAAGNISPLPPVTLTIAKAEPKPEPIIPLVHAPDDPGPDIAEESDIPVQAENGWRKIFG